MKDSKALTISFKSDTKKRKKYFTPEHFAHPAKMHLGLLLWIVGKYTEAGETILDPMAGAGTTMLATTLGRNVVLVDLEEKFCQMMEDNWAKLKADGWGLSDCQIIQGDARQLEGLLVDKIVTSPPYSDISMGGGLNTKPPREGHNDQSGRSSKSPSQEGAGGYVDKCIFSPPYAESNQETSQKKRDWQIGNSFGRQLFTKLDEPNNVGNLPYGQIDKIVTSPPYDEGTGHGRGSNASNEILDTKKLYLHGIGSYSEDMGNIGNMKGQSYLEAMLQVYQQCHKVLKPQGLMILVTKDFIRNKQRIRLSLDTIALCEQAGFELIDWHFRRLLTQSFWRVIYYKKHPEVERIDNEDVLVFRKGG